MDINRNQYFMIGLVFLLLGMQFRLIDSLVLNEPTTEFLAKRTNNTTGTTAASIRNMFPAVGPSVNKVVHPPEWIGWALMSFGAVLILHSLAMPRPGGG